MCLESDLNRHCADFESALSTVGVPRLSFDLAVLVYEIITARLYPGVIGDVRSKISCDKREQRHQLHPRLYEHAGHWWNQVFQEGNQPQSRLDHLFSLS